MGPLLALLTAALAGVPVQLPEGEDPAAWLDPLALYDLEPSAGPAPIVILDRGESWSVSVDRGGEVLRLEGLAPPADGRDREALASRLASLLRPITFELPPAAEPAGGAVAAPAAAAPVSAPEDSPAPAALPPPAASPAPAEGAAPAPEASAGGGEPEAPSAGGLAERIDPGERELPDSLGLPGEPAESASPDRGAPEPAEPVGSWLRLGGSLGLRPYTAPGPGVQIAAGLSLGGRTRLGLGLAAGTRVAVRSEPRPSVASAALRASARWSPAPLQLGSSLAAELGLVGELSRRSFTRDGWSQSVLVPALAPELGLRFSPGGAVSPGLFGRGWVDLRSGEAYIGGEYADSFSPLGLELGLSVSWGRAAGES